MSAIRRNTCRVCRGAQVTRILSLGEQPLVDSFVDAEDMQGERRYPLDLYFCHACGLVQLLDIVARDELFNDAYAYFSSASEPLVDHFRSYASDLMQSYLTKGDFIVDIGSNDGILLRNFLSTHRVLGIEPSAHIAKMARSSGVATVDDFFSLDVAKQIVARHGKAQIISANNVLAHIDNLDEMVSGVNEALADDGVFVSESHYLLDLIERTEFDTVYHEHVSYFSLKPLVRLFERFNMEVFDVRRVSVHGGSIRIYVRRNRGESVNQRVRELLALEEASGLYDLQRFTNFQKEVEALRGTLVGLVRGLRAEGKSVIAYGAPAKGNTLLNFCGFTTDDIQYVTDTTPYKVGRLTPGSHIPVRSPDILRTETPDYILLLAWNYKEFILQKEQQLRDRGSQFIIPLPRVEIV